MTPAARSRGPAWLERQASQDLSIIVRIVEASPADSDATLSVERTAFARDDEAELFTKVVFAGASCHVPAALLAPLAVIPEFQRHGVGRALTEQSARTLAASGVQLVFVLGDPAYYSKFGFVPAVPQGLYAPYPIVPLEAWMVRPLAPNVLSTAKGGIACAQCLARPDYWRE